MASRTFGWTGVVAVWSRYTFLISTCPLSRQNRLFPRLQEKRFFLMLLQEIMKSDAVKRFLDFCANLSPDHSGHAVVGLVAISRLARLQAMGQRYRPLKYAHNVAYRQLRRFPREQISACGTANALD